MTFPSEPVNRSSVASASAKPETGVREFTPREAIDEKRFEVGFCEKHGYFAAGIKASNAPSRWLPGCPRCLAEAKIRKLFGQSMIPRRFEDKRFSNYEVSGDGQKSALESCRMFVEEIKNDWLSGRTLVLTGTPGTGKTHLACAVGHEVMRMGRTVLFTTVTRLLEDIKAAWNEREHSVKNIIARYVSVDLLILDEIGAFRGITEREKDYLFEVINERYEGLKPMIAVSNLRLTGTDSLEAYLEKRSFDRLCEQARLVIFDWESYRRRAK